MSNESRSVAFTPTRGKISPDIRGKNRKAIELMAQTGLSATEAAKQVGARTNNVTSSLRSKQGAALYKHMVKEIRGNAAQAAYLRINHQSQTAESERLKYDANRWVAGVDGISPVQKVTGTHQHNHTFGGFGYEDEPTIIDNKSVADDG